MTIHVKDSVVTFEWALAPTGTPLLKTDYDIALILPNGVSTYTDDGITTYTAPTATVQGKATYNLTPTVVGRHQVTLSNSGTSAAHIVDAIREIFIVELPPVVEFGIGNPGGPPGTTLQGPEIVPEVFVPQLAVGSLVNVAYFDAVYTFGDSGGPHPIIWDTITGPVPAEWTNFSAFSSIEQALWNIDSSNITIGLLEAPEIISEGKAQPYEMFDTEAASTSIAQFNDPVAPGPYTLPNFRFTFTLYPTVRDTNSLLGSMGFGGEQGGGGTTGRLPSEWVTAVTLNANSRLGVLLSGTPLTPNVSANWTRIGVLPFLPNSNYAMASGGTNLVLAHGAGSILRSTDHGVNWAEVNDTGSGTFFQLLLYGNGIFMIFNSLEAAWKSVNDGVNWTSIASIDPLVVSMVHGYFVPDWGTTGRWVLNVYDGVRYTWIYSDNDGTSWNTTLHAGGFFDQLYAVPHKTGGVTKLYSWRSSTTLKEYDDVTDVTGTTIFTSVGGNITCMINDLSNAYPPIVVTADGTIHTDPAGTTFTDTVTLAGVTSSIDFMRYFPSVNLIIGWNSTHMIYINPANLSANNAWSLARLPGGQNSGWGSAAGLIDHPGNTSVILQSVGSGTFSNTVGT